MPTPFAFNESLEAAFRRAMPERYLSVARVANVAGATFLLLFAVWDWLNDPTPFQRWLSGEGPIPATLVVRLITCAGLLMLFLFSRTRRPSQRLETVLYLAVCTAVFGTSVPLALQHDGFENGVASLVVLSLTPPLFAPEFRLVLRTSVLAVVVINVVALFAFGQPTALRQVNLFVIPAASLSCVVALALERRNRVQFLLEKQLEKLATTDALTGVSNRRHFVETAEHELERARRYGNPLSLLLLDIDHFKRINDTYGHAAGDDVLCALVRTVEPQLRNLDLLGRLGGEEFAVLLLQTDTDAAHSVAERLRKTVSGMAVRTMGEKLNVTVSIGVTSFDIATQAEDVRRALERADEALYKAKESGRNRVSVG